MSEPLMSVPLVNDSSMETKTRVINKIRSLRDDVRPAQVCISNIMETILSSDFSINEMYSVSGENVWGKNHNLVIEFMKEVGLDYVVEEFVYRFGVFTK